MYVGKKESKKLGYIHRAGTLQKKKKACHQPQSARKGNTGVYFLSSSFRFPSLPLSYHTSILVSPSRRSQVHDVPYRWYLGLGNGGQVSSQIG